MRWCLVSVWTKTCIETCSSNVRDLQCFYILLSLFLFIIIGLEIDIFLKSSIVRITQPQSCTMWFQTGPNLWSIASLFFTSLCGTLQLKGTKFHHPATVPFRPPAGFFRGCRVGFWVWYIRYIHSCFNLCSAGFGMFRMYSQKKNTLKGFSHGGFNAPMVSFLPWWSRATKYTPRFRWLSWLRSLPQNFTVPRCSQKVDFFLCQKCPVFELYHMYGLRGRCRRVGILNIQTSLWQAQYFLYKSLAKTGRMARGNVFWHGRYLVYLGVVLNTWKGARSKWAPQATSHNQDNPVYWDLAGSFKGTFKDPIEIPQAAAAGSWSCEFLCVMLVGGPYGSVSKPIVLL